MALNFTKQAIDRVIKNNRGKIEELLPRLKASSAEVRRILLDIEQNSRLLDSLQDELKSAQTAEEKRYIKQDIQVTQSQITELYKQLLIAGAKAYLKMKAKDLVKKAALRAILPFLPAILIVCGILFIFFFAIVFVSQATGTDTIDNLKFVRDNNIPGKTVIQKLKCVTEESNQARGSGLVKCVFQDEE